MCSCVLLCAPVCSCVRACALDTDRLRSRVVSERGAIVSDDARITGSVTIGKGSVVHARCTITADTAPITIGAFNIVEENAVIINRCAVLSVLGD